MVRVLVVSKATIVRFGIRKVLSEEKGFVIRECQPARGLARMVKSFLPDVVLLDCQLDETYGLAAAEEVLCIRPEARVIVISRNPCDERSFAIIRRLASVITLDLEPWALSRGIEAAHADWAFVRGSSPTSPDQSSVHKLELSSDIKQVLSRREREVLTYVAKGNNNRTVARLLGIGEQTVKSHVAHILRKLMARDRGHAVAIAYKIT